MLQGRTLQWGRTKDMAGNMGVLIRDTVYSLMYLNLAFYAKIMVYTLLVFSNILKINKQL